MTTQNKATQVVRIVRYTPAYSPITSYSPGTRHHIVYADGRAVMCGCDWPTAKRIAERRLGRSLTGDEYRSLVGGQNEFADRSEVTITR